MGLHHQEWGVRPVKFFVLAGSLALLSLNSLAGPMDLGGQFAVNESGVATYTIPLQVPPGTGGIEPKLALTYNSQSGNGLLGVGWSLSGLSAIGRCPQTMAQDGVRGGVNFDANDRFCLDGQRLMVVNGTYGADGAEYRTERESFAKIISYGSGGNGPAWFKVWTKAGQIIEYGNTADSRIEAIKASGAIATWPIGTVRAWAQNKLSDTKGDSYTLTYTEDVTNGDFYPSRIDYTGNSNTGLAPNDSVQFVFEARPDIVPVYYAGSVSTNKVRMKTVQAWVGGEQIKEYRLAYGASVATKRTRLASLAVCGISCLPPISLTWSDFSPGFAPPQGLAEFVGNEWFNSSYPGRVMVMDVNGDGRPDLVAMGTGVTYIALNNGNGFDPKITLPQVLWNEWFLASAPGRVQVMDVNGDGKADVVAMGTGVTYVALSNGAGFDLTSQSQCLWNEWFLASYPGRVQVVDLGGTGIRQPIGIGTGVVYSCPPNGSNPDMLVSINNSLGSSIWFMSQSLTNGIVYSKGTGSTYPLLDIQAPMYVVSAVSSSNGVGGTLTMNYKYGGLKAELGTGRGLLGFNWIESAQVETGLTTHTDYRQDWPYVGLPSQVKKTQSSAAGPNQQLSVSTATYGCLNPQSGSPCAVAAGNRYFPYASQSVESSWDLNGAVLPTLTTTNQFDSYGNATQISVSTGDGYGKTTTNTYQNDTSNWFLGRLLRAQVQSTAP